MFSRGGTSGWQTLILCNEECHCLAEDYFGEKVAASRRKPSPQFAEEKVNGAKYTSHQQCNSCRHPTSMAHPTKVRNRPAKSEALDPTEKDEVELRLEKAVFGDDAGFLESLQKHELQDGRALTRYEQHDLGEHSSDGADDVDEGLSDVADEEVCFDGLLSFNH